MSDGAKRIAKPQAELGRGVQGSPLLEYDCLVTSQRKNVAIAKLS